MGSSRCGRDSHDGWEEVAMLEQSYVGQQRHHRMEVHAPGDWSWPQEAQQMVLTTLAGCRMRTSVLGPVGRSLGTAAEIFKIC